MQKKVVHSTTSEKQQNDEQLKTVIEDILKFGDLLLIANKGEGKTNALMVLAERFREQPDTRLVIFEDFPKWMLEFSEIPYMVIHDEDVKETSHTVDMEDYFLRHERDYTVKRGLEIQEALEKTKDIIFVSEVKDIERQAFFIYSVVEYFYRRAYLRKYKNYNRIERIIFVIEESQNVFDSTTISKALFNRMRKIFSVARNLDLHFVLCSQRPQDLNTRIRGRTRLLLGCVSADDYELKVYRLLRHSKYRQEILTFERGRFLYAPTDTVIQFPKFEPIGKPYEFRKIEKPEPQPQEKQWSYVAVKPKQPSKLQKIKSLFRLILGVPDWNQVAKDIKTARERKRPQTNENHDEDEEEEEDISEEHAGLLAEDEEEEEETLFW